MPIIVYSVELRIIFLFPQAVELHTNVNLKFASFEAWITQMESVVRHIQRMT